MVLHVVGYNRHVSVAHSVCVVTCSPKLATPQFYFDFRVGFEEMISSDTFYFLDHIREPYVWNGLNKKVDMIFVNANLEEIDIVGRTEFQTDVGESFRDSGGKDISSVFHWTDEVVYKKCLVVWFFNVL